MAPRPKTKAALQPAGEPFLGQSDGEQDDVLNARDQLLHDNLQNYLAAVGGNKAGAKLQPLRQVAGLGNNTNAAGATGAGGSGAAGAGLQQGGKQAQAQQQAQAVAQAAAKRRPAAGGQTAAQRAHAAAAAAAHGAAAGPGAAAGGAGGGGAADVGACGGAGGNGGGGGNAAAKLNAALASMAAAAGGGGGDMGGAAGGGAGGSGGKRKQEAAGLAAAPGRSKQPRAAATAAAVPLATDRDGLPTLEGLRAWAAAQVAALNDKVSGPMMAPVIKAIEEGFNKLNRRAAADHLEVEKHIKTSNESLQTAASQHAAVQRDVHEMLEGLLDDLESGRSELLGALRTEVVAPLEAALSGLAAKYKIRLAAD
ncbi:hypothetical protein CHLRE_02g093900v5 [Chlamydomonas reinhardtii]|uniref:Uncharacterized protein n=1 Tax=Chlamydomonas reinhardtii TaxID=3055 RepID=A0A2K3E1I5_CHLRE|nr:uncharacterized protein CHLRE_02g093900v5 [Chlamydomonas reinhardtii]PNW86617.1 hypothetical protein CHLRE_02g093900v5 [Chlamydomonas reinhardtii]